MLTTMLRLTVNRGRKALSFPLYQQLILLVIGMLFDLGQTKGEDY
jgi:hypothetical protein